VRVELQPPSWATHLLSDLTDWQRSPLAVTEMAPFDLPDDVYFEYAYRDAAGEHRPDPANRNPRLNPWWKFACHLTGPTYRPEPLARVGSVAPRGRLERLTFASRILGERRTVYLYSPAGSTARALPHVLFQDGKAYLGWGKVPQVFDRLLAGGQVRPAHLIMVPPREREREYAFAEDYERFIVEEVLPRAAAARPCDGERVAWGASLGGLFGAHLAWRQPDLFASVVTQSGAFLYSPGQDFDDPFGGDEYFIRQVRDGRPRSLRWYLDCGTLEWLRGPNERLHAALRERGASARLVLRNAGHNWTNWRNGLAGAFRFALGVESPELDRSDGS